MGVEPERKFLLASDAWRAAVSDSFVIRQAYLSKEKGRTVRVRTKGPHAYITIKGEAPEGTIDTPEFEYEIPMADAEALFALCLPGAIEKTRHLVPHAGKTWEVDVFHGDNDGLVMAEIELTHGNESFDKPAWVGAEVTHDPRYKNSALSEKPYTTWDKPAGGKPPQPAR